MFYRLNIILDSCTKCVLEGKCVENTVCFPGVEKVTLKTDDCLSVMNTVFIIKPEKRILCKFRI